MIKNAECRDVNLGISAFFLFFKIFSNFFTNFEELSKIYKYNYMSKLKKEDYANGSYF